MPGSGWAGPDAARRLTLPRHPPSRRRFTEIVELSWKRLPVAVVLVDRLPHFAQVGTKRRFDRLSANDGNAFVPAGDARGHRGNEKQDADRSREPAEQPGRRVVKPRSSGDLVCGDFFGRFGRRPEDVSATRERYSRETSG
jgi:hypothetical protein